MKIDRALLLLSMALAAIALAAPTAAQAELTWSEERTFEIAAEIGWQGGGLITGAGVVDIHGEVFNAGGMGSGVIDDFDFTGVLPTNLPGCHAVATATATPATPWPITLTTEDTIDIGDEEEPVTFIGHYTTGSGPGCPAFKVPSTVAVAGVITGTITNDGLGSVCINLNNHSDDLIREAFLQIPVDLFNPAGDPSCMEVEGVEVE